MLSTPRPKGRPPKGRPQPAQRPNPLPRPKWPPPPRPTAPPLAQRAPPPRPKGATTRPKRPRSRPKGHPPGPKGPQPAQRGPDPAQRAPPPAQRGRPRPKLPAPPKGAGKAHRGPPRPKGPAPPKGASPVQIGLLLNKSRKALLRPPFRRGGSECECPHPCHSPVLDQDSKCGIQFLVLGIFLLGFVASTLVNLGALRFSGTEARTELFRGYLRIRLAVTDGLMLW